ncbi:VOC family protein [Comamonas sp. NLF-1-9]|uniref:VOC family protein n=1 Tax=Comamonas sp. NLF-1-9 TaxID=2853163 RepID=UPI001C45ED72|nr:VOC family protein [Comamonas sp. NLF-1-9]QXL83919.1 VOC family protein [Comamonas sp. NLF-1-9]
MPPTLLDHLVVTCHSLDAGAAYVAQVLGVAPLAGGEHPRMATHNRLLRLGESCYLEVIAPKPEAPAPGRARWFGLDALPPGAPPALRTWVARSSTIEQALAAASEPLGVAEPMSRGALNWLISLGADGTMVLDGAAPALIQWQDAEHPAARMPELGLALQQLEIIHPEPDRLSRLLSSLALQAPVRVRAGDTPRLVAHIRTPQGLRLLSSP